MTTGNVGVGAFDAMVSTDPDDWHETDERAQKEAAVASAERAVQKARWNLDNASSRATREKEQVAYKGAKLALAQATAELKGLD